MGATTQMYDERELTKTVQLCSADGQMNPDAVGWSRHPLHVCNLPASLPRKKKWNYWAVTSNDLLFSATIADVERLQLGGAYMFERRTQRHIDNGVVRSPGTIVIPETVSGHMVIEHPAMRVALTDQGAGTRIHVEAADFGGMPLEADILIERPAGHETLNVVIPWTPTQFQFTSKQNTLPRQVSYGWAMNASSCRSRRSAASTTGEACGRSIRFGTGVQPRGFRRGRPLD